jgi:hypothetical protein
LIEAWPNFDAPRPALIHFLQVIRYPGKAPPAQGFQQDKKLNPLEAISRQFSSNG